MTFQDLTDIKKLERDARMQQRLAAVGEMAAGIAHEIRNPLASMSGSIQILRQELPLSAEQEQLMDIVLRESERLNDDDPIVSGLRAAAAVRRSPGSTCGARCNDAALLLRNSAEVHDGHIDRASTCRPTELWYEADEGQIKQIVWNLATNGLRAMPDGGRLRLAGAVEPASSGVVITVAGRRDRHRARGARRPVPAVPRQLREGQRPRAGDRPPDRDRLPRRDPGQLAAGRRAPTVSVRLPARAEVTT